MPKRSVASPSFDEVSGLFLFFGCQFFVHKIWVPDVENTRQEKQASFRRVLIVGLFSTLWHDIREERILLSYGFECEARHGGTPPAEKFHFAGLAFRRK